METKTSLLKADHAHDMKGYYLYNTQARCPMKVRYLTHLNCTFLSIWKQPES
jgi:hypothetical protein